MGRKRSARAPPPSTPSCGDSGVHAKELLTQEARPTDTAGRKHASHVSRTSSAKFRGGTCKD
eukprot:3323971-Prymnesium_polylepis.1